MSEGPQVKLRTEWLSRHLTGRRVLTAGTGRLKPVVDGTRLQGRDIRRCYCRGKNILIEFSGGLTLHNHLLMRGKWRREPGQLLLVAEDIWLALYVGAATICNVNGQKLVLLDDRGVEGLLRSLGPDVLDAPFPEAGVSMALKKSDLPIAEALLAQGVVCGIGNVARSEILFAAGLSPFVPSRSLSSGRLESICRAIQNVMGESYRTGGRWTHHV